MDRRNSSCKADASRLIGMASHQLLIDVMKGVRLWRHCPWVQIPVTAKCFFLGYFLLLSLFIFPHHVNSLSLSQCLLVQQFGFFTCIRWRWKESQHEKILAAPSVKAKHRCNCNVWERLLKMLPQKVRTCMQN